MQWRERRQGVEEVSDTWTMRAEKEGVDGHRFMEHGGRSVFSPKIPHLTLSLLVLFETGRWR